MLFTIETIKTLLFWGGIFEKRICHGSFFFARFSFHSEHDEDNGGGKYAGFFSLRSFVHDGVLESDTYCFWRISFSRRSTVSGLRERNSVTELGLAKETPAGKGNFLRYLPTVFWWGQFWLDTVRGISLFWISTHVVEETILRNVYYVFRGVKSEFSVRHLEIERRQNNKKTSIFWDFFT